MDKNRESESTLRKSRHSTYVSSFKSIQWAAKKVKESRKMMALQVCPINEDKENTVNVIIQKFGSSKVHWMKFKKGLIVFEMTKESRNEIEHSSIEMI